MLKNALIVDSEKDCWQSIGAFLGARDYSVVFSEGYPDALVKVQAQNFDLIIVDMGWPGREGISVLPQFHRLQPQAAIIAVGESTDGELVQEALNNGADLCLGKPVVEADLLQAMTAAESADNRQSNSESVMAKNIGQTLLRGFTPDQQWDFRMVGKIRSYQLGDVVPVYDDSGSMVWVEQGKLLVYYNNVAVESLEEGDFWGEDAFVNASSLNTYLVAQDAVQLRHFSRKHLIEYFSYQDETLTKRYMINLINCLHLKWHRTIARLVKAILPATSRANENANASEL